MSELIKAYDRNAKTHEKLDFAIKMLDAEKIKDPYYRELLEKNPENLIDMLKTLVTIISSYSQTAGKYVKDTITNLVADELSNVSSEKYDSLEEIEAKVEDILTQQYSDILINGQNSEKQNQVLVDTIHKILQNYRHLTEENKIKIVDNLSGYGPISKYMAFGRDDIEEIQINDFNNIVVIKNGKAISVEEQFKSPSDLNLFVSKLVNRASKQQKGVKNISEADPYTRIRIGESTRVSIMGGGIVGRPITLQRTLPEDERKVPPINICIRKQKNDPITTDQMLKWGSTDSYTLALLKAAIGHGVSVMGFGQTGSGKTAMFRAITVDCVPEDLRIVTVAETDEMQLRVLDTEEFLYEDVKTKDENGKFTTTKVIKVDENGKPVPNPNYLKPKINALMWEIPNKEIKILGATGFTGAVNATLTFTPEMIIFQETKGGEIKDLVEEAVSGHQVMTTIHVNDAKYVPLRILLMYQQSGTKISDDKILQQVPAAFPLLVEFKRYKDGSRKVASVNELVGFDMTSQQAVLRPLSKFIVERNYIDSNGKRVVEGSFKAICDPLDEREGTLLGIMKDNFLTDDEIAELKSLYEAAKDNELLEIYKMDRSRGVA